MNNLKFLYGRMSIRFSSTDFLFMSPLDHGQGSGKDSEKGVPKEKVSGSGYATNRTNADTHKTASEEAPANKTSISLKSPAGSAPSKTLTSTPTEAFSQSYNPAPAKSSTPLTSGQTGVAKTIGVETIRMTDGEFVPKSLTVAPGDTIKWVNEGEEIHGINSDSTNKIGDGPNSGDQYPTGLAKDESYSWTVPEAKSGTTWFYHCGTQGAEGDGSRPGNGMTGSITVK